MSKTDALRLADALESRVVRNWVHGTGETPKAVGVWPDRECHQAAAELRRLSAQVEALEADAARFRWIPVAERMPENGVTVLAAYQNELGNWRRIRARWIAAKTVESYGDSDIGEYDEATDTYYDPEGWYECMENWDEYAYVAVHHGEPTHWMPLPEAPVMKEQT